MRTGSRLLLIECEEALNQVFIQDAVTLTEADSTLHGVPLNEAEVTVVAPGQPLSPGLVAPESHTGALTVEGSLEFASLTLRGGSAQVTGSLTTSSITADNATLTINGRLIADNLSLTNSATLRHSNSSIVDISPTQNGSQEIRGADIIVANDFLLDETSRIDLTGRGYAPGEGPGAGENMFAGSTSGGPIYIGSGAGHGGIGGAAFGRQPDGVGRAYGDLRWPTEFGSGGGRSNGGAGCNGSSSQGAGGGALSLRVEGELHLDGDIIADGASSNAMTGAGAGGSILITTSSLTGSGDIRANGGRVQTGAGLCGHGGGAGAGGRIAVYAAETTNWTGAMLARAGDNGARGGAGTVYFSGSDRLPTLTIDNTGAGGGFIGQSGITPFAGEVIAGNIEVRGGARLAGEPGGEDMKLIVAADIVVEEGAFVSVDEFVPAGTGPAAGFSGGASGGGGGHGGAGGRGGDNSFDGLGGEGGATYGTASLTPPTGGSGGGAGQHNAGGAGTAGGGFIEVNAAGALIIEGAVSANATQSQGAQSGGGGSGGGILLRAGMIAGDGQIAARGGPGGFGHTGFGGWAGGGGGGGGRIVWATCDGSLSGNVVFDVDAGAGGIGNANGQDGEPGSIDQRSDYSSIRRDPASTTVWPGTVAELTFVAPTGPGSSFQWSRNGEPLSDGPTPHGSIIRGTGTPVLLILFVAPEDEAQYTCAATGPCGSTVSEPAGIAILGTTPPCLCETDNDPAQVDVFDLLAYLDSWFAQAPAADIDGTEGVDVFDLLAFLDCWFTASTAGCN